MTAARKNFHSHCQVYFLYTPSFIFAISRLIQCLRTDSSVMRGGCVIVGKRFFPIYIKPGDRAIQVFRTQRTSIFHQPAP
jgi:hypothetical protein